ncbi:MAG: lactate dehydrogenase [Elusimicrobia bacterium RIFOXYA1_FULL_47_7]|nr:MAG: lactate dehydrogenase [Elusimicrobia bacterium RIFOXYA12_FULL_49_49]OGS06680.1 MAG: lactate dehydrogenase [Elusimicrobia bacterium RIFOXYA1_FULL_47_7]OGS09599.1 MAG: lactate dehydrogenase [Elusimicrobia bacterium RIFOXYB1_FULL_48_9]OGS16517.1 MAG: lactate dehydrogenase [Elusimicrobia bacterium RIFOXYA2_FULL_47_53]OGS26044.1 MAG: lactate dehydrogenase [Elusimicrobia bacterium RIFOXYB12_FULL_50_12]OGS29662.1 MAG: lactate dehydrogenase [Elusimicrobia bacterium RIFOXYB2_FULL_46_23]
MADVFEGLGCAKADARVCAQVLIEADKRGIDSHGIGRMKSIYYDRIKEGIQFPKAEFEIVKEGPTTAVIDGHDGMGHAISKRAMRMAIDKAKKYGLGMTVVRNSTHYGIAGYYATMATEEGLIGITGTNARPSVAPTFGVENMLGTNPLTFGIPTDEDFPFVLDCATSLSQRGKIEVYDRLGKDLPAGWVIDENGQTRTDTHKILSDLVKGSAALTPLGGIGEETAGHKGYGYCTVVEILSSALQQGSFLKMLLGFENGRKTPYHLGHFFMAIDISAFTELENFKKTSGDILRALRKSKKAPGQQRIYTAGEKEYLAFLERKETGVPLTPETQKEIKIMQKEMNLAKYEFPF